MMYNGKHPETNQTPAIALDKYANKNHPYTLEFDIGLSLHTSDYLS